VHLAIAGATDQHVPFPGRVVAHRLTAVNTGKLRHELRLDNRVSRINVVQKDVCASVIYMCI
ncbi:MAG: hypothetical protein ACAH88_13420, partial [Roseimicrobium sp.]